MAKILIVEDELPINNLIMRNLSLVGHECKQLFDGESAVKEIWDGGYDLVLLDVMLPGIDGFEVLRRLRAHSQNIGIIMLTAKTQEIDRINRLMTGAHDYVTKPFSPSELTARIDALCRRIGEAQRLSKDKASVEMIKSGPFEIDVKSRVLYKNGREIELTGVEFQIVQMFIKNSNTALERSEILKAVWGEGHLGEEKIVDVNIRRIRMKIEDEPSNPQYIQTVWGFGYKWPKM